MIAGLFSRRDTGDSITSLSRSFDEGELFKHFPFDTKGKWKQGGILLLQQDRHNTPQSCFEDGPIYDPESGLAIAAWASLYNRQEIFERLDISSDSRPFSDSQLILKCYQRWQEDCVNYLVGDFAFVIMNTKKNRLFCARDPLGIRPFYYQLSSQQFSFASSLGCFRYMPDCDMTPSQKWVADFMTGLSNSWNETPYSQINKLPPAHALIVGKDEVQLYAYFTFNGEQSLSYETGDEAVEAYKEQLNRAVLSRFDSDYPLGFELSGGIDSSTITSYAGHNLQGEKRNNIQTFAHVTCEQEPEYIQAVGDHYGLMATHILPADELQHKSSLRAIQILGYPVEHVTAISSEPFYRQACQQNVRTLFSGFGGDEFVTTYGSLLLRELYYQGRWRDLYYKLPGNALTRALRIPKLVQRMMRTGSQKYTPRFMRSFKPRWRAQPLLESMVKAYDLEDRYFKTARYEAGYRSLNEFTLDNRWVPFVPTRTENGTLMAAARGIEYRWPLLDHRLIQHFLSTPTTEKYHRGVTRYLHRRAIAGIVPDKVAWKPSKDMGLSRRSAAYGNISDLVDIEDLHPMLKELLDGEKLTVQRNEFLEGKLAGNNNLLFQINNNFTRLHWLDIWLKDYLDS